MQKRRPVMLVILDGWGWREETADNAVRQAKTPTFDRLWASCPHAFLRTSGKDVGLPDGQMGNSEVGHLNIGAGRVVMQDLPRINAAVANGTIQRAPALIGLIQRLRETGGTCHLMGLVSPGGVHSHQDHAVALAKILASAKMPTVVHAFTDGRDTPPQSAADDLDAFARALPREVPIATVSGRYYAMDRDARWERVTKAYNAIMDAQGHSFPNAQACIADAYAQRLFDEFIVPAVIGNYRGIKSGDGVLCFNFRSDRVREILGVILDPPEGSGFARRSGVQIAAAVGMTQYSDELDAADAVDFPAADVPQHPRRGRRRRRPHAAAHGGDREISARHLLPQRRPRRALRGRGAHHGAVAEGRDLRHEAGNVGAGIDRQGGDRDQVRPVRPDRAQLRQSRHGRPHRQPAGGDQGGGDGRRRARPHRRGRSRSRAARCWSPPTTAIAN